MSKRQDQAVARVRARAVELRTARAAEVKASRAMVAAVKAARKAGVPRGVVATAAGVSGARVSQMCGDEDTPGHAADAQKKGPPVLRVLPADTLRTLPDTVTRSGLTSVRERRPYARATMFYDVATGAACMESGAMVPGDSGPDVGSLADVLAACQMAPEAPARVYLTGPTPFAPQMGATRAEGVRAWALSEPAPGWVPSKRGHYMADPTKPVLRFVHEDTGHAVTVMRAAAWWGETPAAVETCAAAWRGLVRQLDAVPAFRGAGLADTPATTGRALWARTIPESGGFDVQPAEVRELIHATAGQGRIELLAPARPEVDRFTYLDGRLMYAALTWGMPVGLPELHRGGNSPLQLAHRGRWRATVTVPDNWRHVGLIMAALDGPDRGAWGWPATPGHRFTTWADAAELHMAMRHGWGVELHEGITWREGKPLNSWRDGLLRVWQAAQDSGSEAGALAARAVRSVILYALGAFAAREHPLTGTCPADQPELVAEDATPGSVRRVGDFLVWETPAPANAWSAAKAHPEWAALVWARARVRVTEAALTVPADRVIGFATDALYLDGDPGWADDGKPGSFRVKGRCDTPRVWPANRDELYAARDEAERNMA